MSVVRPVSASVWQENRGQRTRVPGVAREWRNAKLNERVREQGEGGERGRRSERKRRQKRGIEEEEEEGGEEDEDEDEESPPSLEWSHNVTCERCLLSHNGER